MLAPGGVLYLSVPVDEETRVEFNAHQVFRESDLEKMFDGLDVMSGDMSAGEYSVTRPLLELVSGATN